LDFCCRTTRSAGGQNKLRRAPTPIVFFDAMNDVDTWEKKGKERFEECEREKIGNVTEERGGKACVK